MFSVFPKFLWRYVALCGAMKSVFFGVFSVFPKCPKFENLAFFLRFSEISKISVALCGVIMWRYEIGVFWRFSVFSKFLWRYVAL